MNRYDPDLSSDEIERRYRVALWDLRHGGTGDLARQGCREPQSLPLKTQIVLALLQQHDSTIHALARRLKREYLQVWGHVCYLRKCQKVEVKRWEMGAKGRRVAVYGAIESFEK